MKNQKTLKVLDLEANLIEETENLVGLKSFTHLEELNLKDNEVESNSNFFSMLKILTPKLVLLDDQDPALSVHKRRKKKKSKNKAKYIKEDLESGANHFISKLEKSFLNRFVNKDTLQIGSLIDQLVDQGEA